MGTVVVVLVEVVLDVLPHILQVDKEEIQHKAALPGD